MALCGKRHSFELPGEGGQAALSPASNAGHGRAKRARGAHYAAQVALVEQQEQLRLQRAARREQILAHLRARFPAMDHKVVSEVLERCGEDVEAAVAQLSSLELATAPVAQQQAQAQQQQDAQQQVGSEGGVQEGAPASGVDVHAHEHSEVAGPSGLAKATAAGLPDPSSPEWVDGLVSEMSAAADLDDAKRRAARVLQTFATAVASAGGDAENARLCTQIDDLARENSILKRAVATLHNRHHEMFKEAGQVGDLKRLVAHQQEQLKQAEISNYTLQMHLRQAADGGGGGEKHNRRGPDVF